MAVLQQRERAAVQRVLDTGLRRDVKVSLYTRADGGLFVAGRECRSCGPTQELLEELSAMSRRFRLNVVDFYKNREEAEERGVNRIPATVVDTGGKGTMSFYGLPAGFELGALLDSLTDVSRGRGPLAMATRRRLKALKEDVHIQVFVTYTCQYSPAVVRIAHAMALESPRVRADVIEVQGFSDLAALHRVQAVPKTVVNDRVEFTGVMSEDALLHGVLKAVGSAEAGDGELSTVSEQMTPLR